MLTSPTVECLDLVYNNEFTKKCMMGIARDKIRITTHHDHDANSLDVLQSQSCNKIVLNRSCRTILHHLYYHSLVVGAWLMVGTPWRLLEYYYTTHYKIIHE